MKQDKRKLREKNTKSKLNKLRTKKKRDESHRIKELLNKQFGTKNVDKKLTEAKIKVKHSLSLVHAMNIAFISDSFTPTLIGYLIGVHSSKVNNMLQVLGFQLDKEKGERRVVTKAGELFFSEQGTSGLKWKFAVVDYISKKYNLTIDQDLSSSSYRYEVTIFYLAS